MLVSWSYYNDDFVKFVYDNDKVLFVPKNDFNRAFGTLIQLSYDEVKREYDVVENLS